MVIFVQNLSANIFKFNLRFIGQYYDEEKRTSYNYHRDYAAGMGRYLQSDPIGLAGGTNTYSYVSGNSLTRVDRFGLWATEAHNYLMDKMFNGLNPLYLRNKNNYITKGSALIQYYDYYNSLLK